MAHKKTLRTANQKANQLSRTNQNKARALKRIKKTGSTMNPVHVIGKMKNRIRRIEKKLATTPAADRKDVLTARLNQLKGLVKA